MPQNIHSAYNPGPGHSESVCLPANWYFSQGHGRKESGFGRERGEAGLYELLATKNVMTDFSNDSRDPFSARL